MTTDRNGKPDHPQSWGEAQDDTPDYPANEDQRPKNREVEDENLKPPKKDGEPPKPATDPRR